MDRERERENEERAHSLPRPPSAFVDVRPFIVILGIPPDPNHVVQDGRSATDFAPRPIRSFAFQRIAALLLWHSLIVPVRRRPLILLRECWDHLRRERVIIVFGSGFDQQHLWTPTISSHQPRHARSRSARPDHDEIVLLPRRQHLGQRHVLHLVIVPLVQPLQSPNGEVTNDDT